MYIVYEEAVTDTYLFHFLTGMLFLIYALHFRNTIRTKQGPPVLLTLLSL